MNSAGVKYPTDGLGRLVGFLLLSLIPFVTLIPDTPVLVWLTQDLVLRWIWALIFLLCVFSFFSKPHIPLSLRLDFPNLIVLLLAGWVLLSVKNSRQSFDSFYSFKSFMALVLCWFSLRLIWDRWPGLFGWFEKVFFWTAVLAGAWVFISTAGRWVWFDYFVRFIPRQGFFPNQNIAAGFLALALVWGSLKLLHREKVPLAAFLFLLPAWGITESRGSMVSLALTVILFLLLHMRVFEERMSRWESSQWKLFGGLVLLLAVSSSLMINRLLNAEEVDPRAYFRIDVWISSFKMIGAQPLFGFGPGTYADIYPYYRPADLWNTFNPFAHNEFLQTAVECGLPAMVLVLLLLGILIREFFGTLLRAIPFQKTPSALASGEMAFYLVLLETLHNSVDFTFHEWSHRLVLLAFITYALRDKRAADDLAAEFFFSRRTLLSGLAVLVVFIGWVLGVGGLRDYMARLYDLRSVEAQQEGNLDAAEGFTRRSLLYRENFMNPWNFLGAIEDARAGLASSPAEREKHYQAARENFEKAMELSPYALTPMENQLQDLIKSGRLDQALDLQQQMVDKLPNFPPNYSGQALLLMRMGRPQEALAAAQKAINLDFYFLPGYLLKGRALEALGRKKEALKAYEDAQEMLGKIGKLDPTGQVEAKIQKLKS